MTPITTGTRVRITGARTFAGLVLGVNDISMIVTLEPDHTQTIHLRRDIASTSPEQWRYGGLPVNVEAAAVRPPDFAERLVKLQEKTGGLTQSCENENRDKGDKTE